MRDKYRKALKNYSTSSSGTNMIGAIQAILLDFGATGIGFEYNDQGKIISLHFKIELEGTSRLIKVPFRYEETAKILEEQGVFKGEDHAYRVSMANVRDWLDAQLALESTKMVKFEEIFLPYFVNHDGRTFFEVVKSNGYLLPESTS